MFSHVRKTSHYKNTLYKFKVRTKTFNPIKISFTNQSINFYVNVFYQQQLHVYIFRKYLVCRTVHITC